MRDFIIQTMTKQYQLEEDIRWAEQQRLAALIRASQKTAYYLPRAAAEALCAQIQAEAADRWYTTQMWACRRCMRNTRNGVPAGLAGARGNYYQCRAMARRFGYAVP